MQTFFRRLLLLVLVGLPLLSLAINAIAWLRYGLDLPFFDDWRGYLHGNIRSLKLSYLFKAVNDTLYPLGLALDALAQRYLGGNSVTYQFLTMVTVLGGLLALQWRLLSLALADKWIVPIGFVSTLLMLQPASYWGRENMAYHQALPLLFLLGAMILMLSAKARDRWRLPTIFALGLLAGLTYISGAFAMLMAGLVLVGLGWWGIHIGDRSMQLRSGVALASAGGLMVVAQVVFAILPNHGATHLHHVSMALPHHPEFWYVFFGKIARALLLPRHMPLLSAVAVGAVFLLAVGICWAYFQRGSWREQPAGGQLQRVATVYIALACAIFVYLLMIAAGRTNFRQPEVQGATAIFQYGFERFHFFWVTILWPWLVAFVLVLARADDPVRQRRLKAVATTLSLVFVVYVLSAGAMRHARQHRDESAHRLPTISCLLTQLQRGGAIFCPEFNMPDLTPAYVYARKIKASFVRHFPILPQPIDSDDPPPWFRWTRDAERVELRNVERSGSEGLPLQAEYDAQVIIRIGKPKEMARCTLLDVDVLLRAEQADGAKFLYRSLGAAGYSEVQSARQPYVASTEKGQRLSFQFESLVGFEDELRLDPTAKEQRFDLSELVVRCRLSNATP
jgi:hypothetical protein